MSFLQKITFFIQADSVRKKHLCYFITKQYAHYSKDQETILVDIQVQNIFRSHEIEIREHKNAKNT